MGLAEILHRKMEKCTQIIVSLKGNNKKIIQGILVFHNKPLEEGRVSEEEKYNI